MTDHPLTNEDCKQILIDVSDSWDPEFEWYPDLRAAYDLGESKGRADMLEQVIKWLKTTQWYLAPSTMADLLEEAMRPEEES